MTKYNASVSALLFCQCSIVRDLSSRLILLGDNVLDHRGTNVGHNRWIQSWNCPLQIRYEEVSEDGLSNG